MFFPKRLRSLLRAMVLRQGRTITYYPIAKYLEEFKIDCVLDVGANIGQFAGDLRDLGFYGRIESFEPMAAAFAALSDRSASDRNWNVHNYALGASDGTSSLNISANGPSSSFLELTSDASSCPIDLAYVASEQVKVKRLDQVIPAIRNNAERLFLKIDTQGFEKSVLEGLGQQATSIVGLQLEVSIVPQYVGEATLCDLLHFVEDLGFSILWIQHGYRTTRPLRLKQIDLICFRV